MLEELICRIFYSRNEAHLAHWKASTLSEHLALGDYYDEVIEKLDKLVEAYQGSFGLIKDLPKKEHEEMDILARLQDDAKFINKNRSEIARKVAALENIVDEIMDLYLTTIYKLKFLKS